MTLRPPPDDLAGVRAMAAAQQHRGPDDEGIDVLDSCILANQRLSILDLSSAGHMPMRSEDGQLALTQNGEIYNYVEVRDELRALGHVFRSDGDTEVILRAYQQWGAACVERFVGMWAFALYDAANEDAPSVARPTGHQAAVRPSHGRAAACSHPRSRRLWRSCARSGSPSQPNLASIATYAATGLVDGLEDTFFEGITRFPAASVMAVSSRTARARRVLGSARARRGVARQTAHRQERGAQTLDEAVRVHLRSDVPLGVCLSGGLDSSAIVGLASRHVAAASRRSRCTSATAPNSTSVSTRERSSIASAADAHERLVEPDDAARNAAQASSGIWTSRRWRWASFRSGT